MTGRTIFRDLDRAECDALLARSHVGRLAYSFHDRVDIEPISYVHDHEWLYGRTAPGSKVRTLEHRPWVALETDEATGPFDWRSVVVRGTIHFPERDGSAEERELYERALGALRKIIPETLTENDPVPFRTLVFGIHVVDVTGREARTEK